MYFLIEPSGCTERKGMVQVRYSFYLDPSDYGWDRHYVEVVDMTDAKYPGEVDKFGNPVDDEQYQIWLKTLPKKWQNNPFHNHIMLVDPEVSDEEVLVIGDRLLVEAYANWSEDKVPDIKNRPLTPIVDPGRAQALNERIDYLKSIVLRR